MVPARNRMSRGGAALVVLAAACLLTAGTIRSAGLAEDDGTTTAAVLDRARMAMARVHAAEAASWREAREALRVSVHKLADEPYVAYVWLARASGGGRISYSSGGPGEQGDELVELAGTVGEAALASDEWATGGAERFVPLAAAAMAREGDHRDVHRYLAVPVDFADGDGAVIAVTYDRTPSAGDPGLLYRALLLGGLASLALGAYRLLRGLRPAAPAAA